jgi:hypothetical protein
MHDTTRVDIHACDIHAHDDSLRGDAPQDRRPRTTVLPRLAVVGLALAALLTGCTVAVRHGGSTTTTVRSSGVIVWAHLGLRFAFPGVVVVERHAGPHHFDTVFTSDASLRGVYGDVDERMRAKGWHRHRYEERNHRVTAVYVRGDQEARVTVVQEGRSGRYRLTIDD